MHGLFGGREKREKMVSNGYLQLFEFCRENGYECNYVKGGEKCGRFIVSREDMVETDYIVEWGNGIIETRAINDVARLILKNLSPKEKASSCCKCW